MGNDEESNDITSEDVAAEAQFCCNGISLGGNGAKHFVCTLLFSMTRLSLMLFSIYAYVVAGTANGEKCLEHKNFIEEKATSLWQAMGSARYREGGGNDEIVFKSDDELNEGRMVFIVLAMLSGFMFLLEQIMRLCVYKHSFAASTLRYNDAMKHWFFRIFNVLVVIVFVLVPTYAVLDTIQTRYDQADTWGWGSGFCTCQPTMENTLPITIINGQERIFMSALSVAVANGHTSIGPQGASTNVDVRPAVVSPWTEQVEYSPRTDGLQWCRFDESDADDRAGAMLRATILPILVLCLTASSVFKHVNTTTTYERIGDMEIESKHWAKLNLSFPFVHYKGAATIIAQIRGEKLLQELRGKGELSVQL